MCDPITIGCVAKGAVTLVGMFTTAVATAAACSDCTSDDSDNRLSSCTRCGSGLVRLATGIECPNCD